MKLFKNKKGFNDIIVVTIIGGVLGSLFILGIFVWKEMEIFNTLNQVKQLVAKVIDVKGKEAEIIEKDNHQDWLTYTNEQHGYSLEYPNTYKIEYSGNQLLLTRNFVGNPPDDMGGQNSIRIVVAGSLDNRYFDFYNWAKNGFLEKDAPSGYSNEWKKEIEIANKKFMVFEVASGMDSVKHYFYIQDGQLIDIYSSVINHREGFLNEEIINTFKFLENIVIDTNDWQTYINEEVGFSFNYPSKMKYIKDYTYSTEELSYQVDVKKIADMSEEIAACLDKNTTLKNIEYLKNEQVKSVCYDWHPLEESIKLVDLGNVNARDSIRLRSWEICDLSFNRELLFYYNGYLVNIIIRGPFQDIVDSMDQYFGNVCGEGLDTWIDQDNIESKFYNELINNTASPVAQEWFDSLEQIILTFKFIN
ncbi:MAG: hypothetical protein WCS88_03715 [Patescibacteria group bacterium]|jgi:hypothetical protein